MHKDTICLLKENDLGIKMAVGIFDEVIEEISNCEMKKIIQKSKEDHESLQVEIENLLNSYSEDEKEPSLMAKSMSWMETNFKLMVDDTDNKVAEIVTNGCNMGTKTLSKKINEYKYADETSKQITKRLIDLEDQLTLKLRKFL